MPLFRSRHAVRFGGALLLAFAASLPAVAQNTAPAPAAEAPKTPVVATIGDLQGLIDSIGAFTSQLDPSMNADTIRMLGGQFGDPGFSAFSKGAGIAVIVEDVDRILIALEAQGEKRAMYAGMLGTMGMTPGQNAEGPLMVATAPDMIEGAASAAAKAALAAANRGRLEIGFELVPIVQKHWPRLRMMSDMLPALYEGMDMAYAGKILQGEALFLLNMMEEMERLDLAIDVNGDGLMFDSMVKPVAGTALASVVSACERTADPSLLNRIGTTGGMRMVGIFPSQAMTSYFMGEFTKLAAQMSLGEEIQKEVERFGSMYGDLFGDQMAASLYGDTIFDGTMVFKGVKDVDRLYKAWEEYAKVMSEGAISEAYAKMGQKWTYNFQRNARKIGEASVQRLTMKMELTGEAANGPEAEMKRAIMGDGMKFEFASPAEGTIVAAMGKVPLESLMSGNTAAPKPLAALAAHGSGGFFYADADFGQGIKSMAPMFQGMPGGPEPEVIEMIATMLGEQPMTMAMYAKGGEVRSTFRIPASLFAVGYQWGTAMGGGPATPMHAQVELDMIDLTDACDMFQITNGRWPTSYDELMGKGPKAQKYIEKLPVDPWTKKPFIAKWNDKRDGPEFISYGADQKPGGEGPNADISSNDE